MFYKKWTFSLKILVMLLAIGLVAMPSAMAAEFGVSLDMTHDMSTDGGLQLQRSSAVVDGNVSITVRYARAIVLAASKVSVTTYDKDGVFVAAPKATVAPTTAATDITLTIPVTTDVTSFIVKIDKGIASADLFNDDTSAEFKQTIQLIADDEGMPMVHSIRRVSDPLLPLGKDDTSVQVVITLSEQPREFKKDHISVTEADVDGDPVALDPIEEVTASTLVSQGRITTTVQGGEVPYLRGLYHPKDRNGNDNNRDEYDSTATDSASLVRDSIHAAIQEAFDLPADLEASNAADVTVLEKAAFDYNTLAARKASATVVGGFLDAEGTAFVAIAEATAFPFAEAPDPLVFPLVDHAMEIMATLGTGADAQTVTFADASQAPGDAPDPADYGTFAAYKGARDFYDLKKGANDLYKAGMAVREAYLAAVKAEEDKDTMALRDYLDVSIDDEDEHLIQEATGRDNMLHPFVVTIKPKFANKNAIVVKVKEFEDRTYPTPLKYMPPMPPMTYTEGVDMLTIKVNYQKPGAVKTGGIAVHLPHGDAPEIPAGGYFLLVRDNGVSGIVISGAGDENDNTKQTPAQLMYNARAGGSVNLETFLKNGGTIDLTTTTGAAMGDVVISEIMWGSDAANADSWKSQWIELHNTTGSKIVIAEKAWTLTFYGANEALPTSGYIDRVGTRDTTNGIFWAPKGSSGRTDVGATTAANPGGIIGTVPLVSMQRAMSAGTYADGTMSSSWSASVTPATNFVAGAEGQRIGTPGAAPPTLTQPTPPTPPTPPAPVTPSATASDIAITEIMVDTGGGRLPQWIELTNTSSAAVSLRDWSVVINNAIDEDVYGGGAPVTVSIGDVELGVGEGVGNGDGEGQSVLLVAWATRNSGNFNAGRVVNLATQLEQTGRYQLLSYNGFRITLVPEQTSPVLASGDNVGNLGQDWDIKDLMSDGGRSSLIRREMDDAGMALMGTSADGWKLASATDLVSGPTSWYGSDEDAGTPGYDSGGPLPVELSMFYPARDKLTGQVVIRWETQSELNNAGFFIKRSQQKKGNFVTINAAMIPGAGTTSEKQSYTYTDTTAQPNVVYFYQIEDVSLDGQRQQLTRGIRLRGHIGAAGKATTIWGELKAQE